jgi:hypothetical protein
LAALEKMKLIEFLIILSEQSINEKIAVAPRRFPEYSNARIKDIDAIEALFQNINKRNEQWRDHDDVYSYVDMWKESENFLHDHYTNNEDFPNIDLDYLSRYRFDSHDVLSNARYNLRTMLDYIDGDNKDIDFVMRIIDWYVKNGEPLQKMATMFDGFVEAKDGILAKLKDYGYGSDDSPEEKQATQAFYDTLNDLGKIQIFLRRIVDSIPKYQTLLDKRAAAYNNNKYLPTDMQKVETLWHTTIHADEIAHQGFQSEKPSGRQGVGMYGDQSGISMTYDKKIAIDIMRGLREFSMIANNQVTARQILGWFNSEGIDLERVRSMMDGIPFEETVKSKTKMYNVYLWLTGIRTNPVFANVDELVEKLVGVNPKDIGIIQAEVDTTKDMTSKPAESELVVSPSAVLSTKRVA